MNEAKTTTREIVESKGVADSGAIKEMVTAGERMRRRGIDEALERYETIRRRAHDRLDRWLVDQLHPEPDPRYDGHTLGKLTFELFDGMETLDDGTKLVDLTVKESTEEVLA